MSMAAGSKLHFEPGSWMEALHDFYVGTIVGAKHSAYLVVRNGYNHIVVPVANTFGANLERKYKEVMSDGEKTLKVIAVGYGRTGTYSLGLALEELGYPTLHTQHLYEHEDLLNMWTNQIFLPSIKAKKIIMGKPDLQMIASSGYQATTDLPVALYYEQVMEEFPDCKFILTIREDSEIWFRSWDTLTKSISQATFRGSFLFTSVRQYSHYLRWLYSIINKDDSYLTVGLPLPDQKREAAIASYEEHNRRVRELIPENKLLEYNVKQGWEPLCQFLEIADCPETPFPRTNSARSVQVQSISAFISPLIVVLFCLFYGFAQLFKRITGMTVMEWASKKRLAFVRSLERMLIGGGKKKN